MTDRLLDANEVVERLRVPVSWVRESTRSGAMPCVELGRYKRYDLADVEAGLRSASVLADDRAPRETPGVMFGAAPPRGTRCSLTRDVPGEEASQAEPGRAALLRSRALSCRGSGRGLAAGVTGVSSR